jgi:hypothetical protein
VLLARKTLTYFIRKLHLWKKRSFRSGTNYPNIEKLARLFDWALGVIFALIKMLFWVLLVIIVVLAII